MSGGTREDHGNLRQESRRSVWGSKQAGWQHGVVTSPHCLAQAVPCRAVPCRAGRSSHVRCGTDRVSAASRLAGSSSNFIFELRGYPFLTAAIIHYCLPLGPLQSASQYRQTDRQTDRRSAVAQFCFSLIQFFLHFRFCVWLSSRAI